MNGGVNLSKVASSIHPFPTLAEMNFKVAGKPFAEKTKRLLKFFFNLRGRACELPDSM